METRTITDSQISRFCDYWITLHETYYPLADEIDMKKTLEDFLEYEKSENKLMDFNTFKERYDIRH